MAAKILVVDDEQPIRDVLAYNLKRANYTVLLASDGEQAVTLAKQEQPDLVILDLLLPGLDGLEVCRILRRDREDVLIIMLTARDDEVDRVVGLELGADDYIVKPFSVRELMARVKNILRRMSPPSAGASIRVGSLLVDASRHEVVLGGTTVQLTLLEFGILHVLARHAGQVFSREQLLEQVWGYDYTGDLRVVDAVVKRLRAKLRDVSPETDFIVTIRGVGYKLES
jgi:two-component system alkaline phosphatase synthesis response regulator PhoP